VSGRLILFAPFFFLFFTTAHYAGADQSLSKTITIDLTGDIQAELGQISFPLVITKLSYESDVLFQPEEFAYLVDFTLEEPVSFERCCQILYSLQAKNKFSQVTLVFRPDSSQLHYHLHVLLEGFWSFDRVKFHGLQRGGDRYRHLYLLEPTERFCIKKHNHALTTIKETLCKEGYFDAHLTDYFDYDQTTKTVRVHIIIDRGSPFVINAIAVTMHGEHIGRDERAAVAAALATKLQTKLRGKVYSQELLNKQAVTIKKYLTRQGFADADVGMRRFLDHQRCQVNLEVRIQAVKRKQCNFFGNHFFSKTELTECLSSFGGALSLVPEDLLQQELLQLYKSKGFLAVTIEPRKTDEGYFFLINEGKRGRIKNIELVGNQKIMSSELYAVIHSGSSLTLVDQEAIKEAIANVIAHYARLGFWDTQICEEYVLDSAQEQCYVLRLLITEGEQRFLTKVTVEGKPELTFCLPGMPLEQPIPFNGELVQRQRQALLTQLHQEGYLYADVRYEVFPDGQKQQHYRLVWHIHNADTPVLFGKIIVQGSYTFPFSFLKREMAFKENDVWNPDLLRESIARLQKFNIFESIYMYPDQVAVPELQKSVMVKIVEDDPFEARVRVGFQQVSKNLTFRRGTTYKVGGSFLFKNPTNAADCFRVDADASFFYRNVFVEYRRPWIINQPIWTVVKGYSNKYIQPIYIGSDKPLYQAVQQGILVGLRRQWLFANFGLTLGNDWMEINHLSKRVARAIFFEPALINTKVPYFYLEPDVTLNYLDDQLNPTSGLLTVLSVKLLLPWARIKPSEGLFKLLFDQSIFFSPWQRVVLAMRLRFGHIFNKDFKRVMPPERFFLGGQNSIRSYEPDFGPPLGSYVTRDDKHQLVPRGGRTMVTVNVEARITIWGSFGVVVFQDLGTLVDPSDPARGEGHLLAGTGFGLRYNTPIGPVRFDIGWKWKKYYPQEGRYAWFLTLGHAF
jgi:outer membrane protein insertion porin family